MNGLELFVRYALPPNLLGYCGPESLTIERTSLLQFEGAVPYLRLIAQANGIKDEFDNRVVEAYWLGNELLRNVSNKNLYTNVEDRFKKKMKNRDWSWLISQSISTAKPFHGFHVFDIYRRAGLMRSGIKTNVLETIDKCRIAWGTVESIDNGNALVEYNPLKFQEKKLQFGLPIVEKFTCFDDSVKPGDEVSLHWNDICDKITSYQKKNLIYWTNYHLDLANQTI